MKQYSKCKKDGKREKKENWLKEGKNEWERAEEKWSIKRSKKKKKEKKKGNSTRKNTRKYEHMKKTEKKEKKRKDQRTEKKLSKKEQKTVERVKRDMSEGRKKTKQDKWSRREVKETSLKGQMQMNWDVEPLRTPTKLSQPQRSVWQNRGTEKIHKTQNTISEELPQFDLRMPPHHNHCSILQNQRDVMQHKSHTPQDLSTVV